MAFKWSTTKELKSNGVKSKIKSNAKREAINAAINDATRDYRNAADNLRRENVKKRDKALFDYGIATERVRQIAEKASENEKAKSDTYTPVRSKKSSLTDEQRNHIMNDPVAREQYTLGKANAERQNAKTKLKEQGIDPNSDDGKKIQDTYVQNSIVNSDKELGKSISEMSLAELKRFTPSNEEELQEYLKVTEYDKDKETRDIVANRASDGSYDLDKADEIRDKYAARKRALEMEYAYETAKQKGDTDEDIAFEAVKMPEGHKEELTDYWTKEKQQLDESPDLTSASANKLTKSAAEFDGESFKDLFEKKSEFDVVGDALKATGTSLYAGIIDAFGAVANGTYWVGEKLEEAVRTISGLDTSKNWFGSLKEQNQANVDAVHESAFKAAKQSGLGDTEAQAVVSIGSAMGQAIPQIAAAMLTGGLSVGASSLIKGAQVATNGSEALKVSQIISSNLSAMMKNPMFLTTVLSEAGDQYDDAVEHGANEASAMTSACLTGLLNGIVEMGGGIETGGGTNILKEAIEEGTEEIWQGSISSLMAKSFYDQDKPIISIDGSDAVLNIKELGLSFVAGSIGGAFGSASIKGVNNIANIVHEAKYNKAIGTNVKNDSRYMSAVLQDGLTSDNPSTVKIAKKINAEITNGGMENVSSVQIGKLVNAVSTDAYNHVIDTIKETGATTAQAKVIQDELQTMYTEFLNAHDTNNFTRVKGYTMPKSKAVLLKNNAYARAALSNAFGVEVTENADPDLIVTLSEQYARGYGNDMATVVQNQVAKANDNIDINAIRSVQDGTGNYEDYLAVTGKSIADYTTARGEYDWDKLRTEAHEIADKIDTTKYRTKATKYISGMVNPSDITEVSKGRITLTDGKTKEIDGSNLSLETLSLLNYSSNAKYDDRTATALVRGYDESNNADLDQYARDFNNVFTVYSVNSKQTSEQRYQSVKYIAERLGTKAFVAARSAGEAKLKSTLNGTKETTKQETKQETPKKATTKGKVEFKTTKGNKTLRRIISDMGEKLAGKGANIVVYYDENSTDNGYYNSSSNTIGVNLASDNPLGAFFHENGHLVKAYAKEYWNDIRDMCVTYLVKRNNTTLDELLKHEKDLYKSVHDEEINDEVALEEVVSNCLEVIAHDEDATKNLYLALQENGVEKSRAQKVIDKFKEILEKISKYIKTVENAFNSLTAVKAMTDAGADFKTFAKDLSDGLAKAINAMETVTEENVESWLGEEILSLDENTEQSKLNLSRNADGTIDLNEWEELTIPDEQSSEQSNTDASNWFFSAKEKIDMYTEKQYNNYGWVRANDILTGKEYEQFNRQWSDAKNLKSKYPKTSNGEYMITVSDQYTDGNVIVFARGSYYDPIITKVIRINTETVFDISKIREEIIYGETRGHKRTYKTVGSYTQKEIFNTYTRNNCRDFRQYREQFRKRANGEVDLSDSGEEQNRKRSGRQNQGVNGNSLTRKLNSKGATYNSTKTLREHYSYTDFMPDGANGKAIRSKVMQIFGNLDFGNEATVVDFYFGDYRMTVSYVNPTDYSLIDFYEIENERERDIYAEYNGKGNDSHFQGQRNESVNGSDDSRLSENGGATEENAGVSQSQSERDSGRNSRRTDVYNGETETPVTEKGVTKHSLREEIDIARAKKALKENKKLNVLTHQVNRLFKQSGKVLDYDAMRKEVAKPLLERYYVTNRKAIKEITDDLYAFYSYSTGQNVDNEKLVGYAYEIAQAITRNTATEPIGEEEIFREFYSSLNKGYKNAPTVYCSPSIVAELETNYGIKFHTVQRLYRPFFNMTKDKAKARADHGYMSWDTVYTSLYAEFPAMFATEETNEADDMREILDSIDYARSRMDGGSYSPLFQEFGDNPEDVIATDIMTRYFDAKEVKPRIQKLNEDLKLAKDKLAYVEKKYKRSVEQLEKTIKADRKKYEKALDEEKRTRDEQIQLAVIQFRKQRMGIIPQPKVQNKKVAPYQSVEKQNYKNEKLVKLADKWGAYKPNEESRIDVVIPKKDINGMLVSRAAKTVLESSKLTEDAMTVAQDELLNGAFSYQGFTNDEARRTAQYDLEKTIKNVRENARTFKKTLTEEEIQKAAYETFYNDFKTSILGDNRGKITLDDLGAVTVAKAEILLDYARDTDNTQLALDVMSLLSVYGTISGRMVQSFNMIRAAGAVGQYMFLDKWVEAYNRSRMLNYENRLFKSKGGFKEIELNKAKMAQLLQATDYEEIERLTTEILTEAAQQDKTSFGEKVQAWRYLSMLGNPVTHVRNVTSNAVFAAVREYQNALRTALEKGAEAYAKSQGKTFHRSTTVKVDQQYTNFAKEYWKKVSKVAQAGGKYNITDVFYESRPIYNSKAMKPLERFTKFNSNMLEKEDAIFLKYGFIKAFSRYLQSNKISLVEKTDAHEEQLRLEAIDEAVTYAIKEAKTATFRNANAAANFLTSLTKTNIRNKPFNSIIKFAVDSTVPFRKTPTNIFIQSVNYSPLGVLTVMKRAVEAKKGEANVSDVMDAIASSLTGTGITLLGMVLRAFGCLTGLLGDDDKQEKKQENSITIFGVNCTLDWASPTVVPLMLGAQVFDLFESEFSLGEMLNVASQAIDPLFNMTCVSSMNDLLTCSRYAQEGTAFAAIITEMLTNYTSQFFPTIGGKIAQTLDGERKSAFYENGGRNVFSMLWNDIKRKVPFLYSTLEPYLNNWGESDEKSIPMRVLQNFLLPGYINVVDDDEVTQFILDLSDEIGSVDVIHSKPKKKFTLYEKVKGKSSTIKNEDGENEQYSLSGSEYTKLSKVEGQTAKELVRLLMHNDKFKGLSGGEQEAVIKDAYKYAQNIGRKAVVDTYSGDVSWVTQLMDRNADNEQVVRAILQRN